MERSHDEGKLGLQSFMFWKARGVFGFWVTGSVWLLRSQAKQLIHQRNNEEAKIAIVLLQW